MRLLLDTQIYLWVLANSPRLRESVRESLETADEVYVSAASVWEACIKVGIGKLDASSEGLTRGIEASGFIELPVLAAHTIFVAELPPIHRDPFDRLLIAQAIAASLRFYTADAHLAPYSDLVTVIDM